MSRRHNGAKLTLFCMAALLAGCSSPPNTGTTGSTATGDKVNYLNYLPNSQTTPGDTLPVTAQDVCVPGYSSKVRNVPIEVKKKAYTEYGILSHQPHEYEVDHLISLELGGSNSIRNLWPQSYVTSPWNAHVKDQLENELHKEMCDGKIDMKTAQHLIATDWIAAYKQVFHTESPLLKSASSGYASRKSRRSYSSHSSGAVSSTSSSAPSASGEVWVNTRSGKYFEPGSHWYGKTKEGKYMPQQKAQQQGFVQAGGY